MKERVKQKRRGKTGGVEERERERQGERESKRKMSYSSGSVLPFGKNLSAHGEPPDTKPAS